MQLLKRATHEIHANMRGFVVMIEVIEHAITCDPLWLVLGRCRVRSLTNFLAWREYIYSCFFTIIDKISGNTSLSSSDNDIEWIMYGSGVVS